MPLPIPDILQSAGAVLNAAKQLIDRIDSERKEHPVSNGAFQESEDVTAVREALKRVNTSDLLAVMNEVGRVYIGMHNIQILQIGSNANMEKTAFEVAITAEFGLGPRTMIVPLPVATATELVRVFNSDLAKLTGTTPGSKLITAV